MRSLAVRGVVELVVWALVVAGFALVLQTDRRDWWLLLLDVVAGIAFVLRLIVWFVRLDRRDTRFNRFLLRHEQALFWLLVPPFLLVLWTTTSIGVATVVLTVAAVVAAVGYLAERRSPGEVVPD